jgi:hypothetical protein
MVEGDTPEGRVWNLGVAIRAAEKFLEDAGLPSISRPKGWGKEYSFPEDLTQLSSVELGAWQSKMEGLWAFAMQLLGKESAECDEFERLYEIKLGLRMQEESGKNGKLVKDILRAIAIKTDPEIEALTQALVTRRLRVRRLDTQVKIYQSHLARLSREQSRREAEARV